MSEFFCLPFFCPIIPFNVGVLFFRFAEFWIGRLGREVQEESLALEVKAVNGNDMAAWNECIADAKVFLLPHFEAHNAYDHMCTDASLALPTASDFHGVDATQLRHKLRQTGAFLPETGDSEARP
jgi:hypothetical protein